MPLSNHDLFKSLFFREQYERMKEDIRLQDEERDSTLEIEKDKVSFNTFLAVQRNEEILKIMIFRNAIF